MRAVARLLSFVAILWCVCPTSSVAADGRYDVFVPITKYLSQGNTERLAAWLGDNLEISVLGSTSISSRNQARQIIDFFFKNHTPRSFNIVYTVSNGNVKYAMGRLNAGGEQYMVTIFVRLDNEKYRIQQLLIEKRP